MALEYGSILFKENGCRIHGYDEGKYKDYYRIEEDEFSNINLTEKVDFDDKYDIAVSLEVALYISSI